MLNKYLAIGNLTQDPTIKAFESGNRVCNFSIAVNTPQGDPFFMDVQAWNNNAEKCQKFLKKGSRVFIEGRLKTNTWATSQGEKRTKIYCSADIVHFLGGNTASGAHNIPKDRTDSDEEISNEELDQIPF